MTSNKKKRMSLLDNLAAAGMQAPSPAPSDGAKNQGSDGAKNQGSDGAKNQGASMMGTNRALRSARNAVDGHHVWDLDPDQIDDHRPVDRLDVNDVRDLRDAIEANGQTVPILVRRHPKYDSRYLLIYGRRRLEAIRQSESVEKIRAIVADMDDDGAIRAQLSENMARRDLSFIEKALLAKTLVESGLGNQSQVAEILTVTKSSVSMAMSIVDMVGEDLVRAIGPALGVGRPRWEVLGRAIDEQGEDREALADIAYRYRDKVTIAALSGPVELEEDISLSILKIIEDTVAKNLAAKTPAPDFETGSETGGATRARSLVIDGARAGVIKRTAKGITLSISDGEFASWVENQAQDLINELHARWQQGDEK